MAKKIHYLGGTKKRITRDEARRIAVNIAKLPELVIKAKTALASVGEISLSEF